jgi:hypothetical protein
MATTESRYIILNRWKNYYSQLLNVYSDVWQIDIHAAESLVSKPSYFDVEITTGMLKIYEFPGSDKILA